MTVEAEGDSIMFPTSMADGWETGLKLHFLIPEPT
jgi:hypothetical protein